MKRTKTSMTKKAKPKKERPQSAARAVLHQGKSAQWWLVVRVDKEGAETIAVKVPGNPRDVMHALNSVSELTSAAIDMPPERKDGLHLKFRPKMPGMRAAILFAYLAELDMPEKATKAMIRKELAACGISLEAGGPSNAELLELMKTNKPPQSWYDEDHTGLY